MELWSERLSVSIAWSKQMQRISLLRMAALAGMSFALMTMLSAREAEAKKYRCKGSSGSSGSSGGWYRSHGSSGSSGSSSSHGSSGSSGGWYSSHGSSGSSGSSSSRGSSGSSGSRGSKGHVIYHCKVIRKTPAAVSKPADGAEAIAPPPTTQTDRNRAVLVLTVPADADVYLAGQKMSISGTQRRFRIPVSDPGRTYSYPVRVEVVRNGRTLVSESKQKVRGGTQLQLTVAETDSAELVAVTMR